MYWERYHMMSSMEETIKCLSEASGCARVIAGGTDVFVQMREMEAEGKSLILLDISRIDALKGIRNDDSFIHIGAAVTMAELAASPVLWKHARALSKGAKWVGSPQIRSVATVGGNIVNALPAADTAIPLVALDAEAYILSPDGERVQPVEDLFVGVGKSRVDPSRELVTRFRIPLGNVSRRASDMQRLAKRKTFTLPQLSSAVCVELDETLKRFIQVRIVTAPLSSTPWRARSAEVYLEESPVAMEHVEAAARMARDDARARSSVRAGADYRKDMTEVLIRRALGKALQSIKPGFDNE